MGLVLLPLVAPLVQVLLVNRLPWGGPDLVTLAVVWPALVRGPVWGCVAGLVAGLAADVTPPADGTVGRTALVLSVTGLLVGWWKEHGPLGRPLQVGWRRERGPLLVAGVGALLGTALQGLAAVALGDEPWRSVVAGLPVTLAWTVGLGAVVGMVLARRRPPPGTMTARREPPFGTMTARRPLRRGTPADVTLMRHRAHAGARPQVVPRRV